MNNCRRGAVSFCNLLSGYLFTSLFDLLPYERKSRFNLGISIYSNFPMTLTMAPEECVQLSVPLPMEEGTDWSGLLESGKLIPEFSSVSQSCPTVCNPTDCSTPGFTVHYQLLELAQIHVHHIGDAILPSHSLSSPSPPALDLSQNQGLFQGVSSSHQMAKVLEFQLQHQSFQ